VNILIQTNLSNKNIDRGRVVRGIKEHFPMNKPLNLISFPEQKLSKVDDLRMKCMLMKDMSQLVRWQ
jgi:hypothetical protein